MSFFVGCWIGIVTKSVLLLNDIEYECIMSISDGHEGDNRRDDEAKTEDADELVEAIGWCGRDVHAIDWVTPISIPMRFDGCCLWWCYLVSSVQRLHLRFPPVPCTRLRFSMLLPSVHFLVV